MHFLYCNSFDDAYHPTLAKLLDRTDLQSDVSAHLVIEKARSTDEVAFAMYQLADKYDIPAPGRLRYRASQGLLERCEKHRVSRRCYEVRSRAGGSVYAQAEATSNVRACPVHNFHTRHSAGCATRS